MARFDSGKAFRAYEESWDRRLQLLCCCVERKGRNQNSMSEIAQLFTEFFRDLDVVPSDIVAGLVLLRHHQKHRMKTIISQGTNDVYQYLSGVPVTPSTRFLQLTQPEVMGEFIKVIHYMRYALAAYGWPVYVMMNPGTWLCRLLPLLSCCCCCHSSRPNAAVVDDNCCGCNLASLKRISGLQDLDIVYATYHVDIGETPFFVALDHEFGKVVVCVRGTLSLQDVLTDLKAEPETLPLNPPRDDWQGHKGMVQAALYIKKKLIDDKILDMAWEKDEEYSSSTHWLKTGRDVAKYDLVCVGHSLGAGTATILAILLKAEYPTLHCYAFSPPGGLLTLPCVEETKSYITSVVVGKDVVPRIGLPQLEMLRTDIINLIKTSRKSKWNIISKGFCCCSNKRFFGEDNLDLERDVTAHPSNSAIGLSAHAPLYPPGKMIHVVRSHVPSKSGCKSSEAIYQAIWASNGDFDEVLVSPTMINDHMPDNVLESLEKVLLRIGPEKPIRTMTEAEHHVFLSQLSESSSATPSPSQAQGFLETSFTSTVAVRQPPTGGPLRNELARSWDHAAEQILHSQDVSNCGTSANPSTDDSTGSSKAQFTLPLSSEPVHAPLASPETLSMASGIVSGSVASGIVGGLSQSDSLRHSLRRSLNSPPSQNSFRHSLSSPPARIEGIHIELSPGQGEGQKGKKTLSGEGDGLVSDVGTVSSHTVHGQIKMVSNDTSGYMQTVPSDTAAHACDTEGTANDSQSECKQTDPSVLPSQSLSQQLSQKQRAHSSSPIGVKENCAVLEFEQNVLSALPSKSVSTTSNEDRTVAPTLAYYPPAVMTAAGADRAQFTTSQECVRHSPVETTQGEYEHPNLHYSQASTGYPHGAYHPPIRYDSDSSAHLNTDCSLLATADSPGNILNHSHRPPEHSPSFSVQASTPVTEPLKSAPTPVTEPLKSASTPVTEPLKSASTPVTEPLKSASTPVTEPLKSASTPVTEPLTSAPNDPSSSPPLVPHPFIHCQSESSIFAKHFPPKLGMKRSAEQTDICHLEDEAEVFPTNKDLYSIKRSAEQTDIAHLGDDLDVFEEEVEDTVGNLTVMNRGRLAATHSTPRSSTVGSVGQCQVNSRPASSSHSSRSDDVFESEVTLEMSETDV